MKEGSVMEMCLLAEERFKKQLLEFIEDREEPFDVEFLVRRCLQPVSEIKIHDALCELVEEGRIIRLDDRHYMSTRVLMKRWLKQKIRKIGGNVSFDGLELPRNLIDQVMRLLKEKPGLGYVDAEDFIRDAIRRSLRHLH